MDKGFTCLTKWEYGQMIYMFDEMGIWTNVLHVCRDGHLNTCFTCLPKWAYEQMFAEMGI